ncbi:MAG TPA: hypothetical protein VM900_00850 [Sphingomonas sp.]|nr:hypothetical protein [Sphingomonas sp.]
MQRRDRRWEIHAGGKRFAIVFSDHRSSAPVASFQVLRRNAGLRPAATLSITKAVGMVLGLLGGVATIGIAIQSGRADAGTASYVVSVPVPEARVAVAVPSRPQVRRPVGVVHTASPVVPAVAPAPEARVTIYDDQFAEDGGGQLTTRQAALSAAMKTGSLQQWARPDGNERGFIVAGPAENGCRELSILVRRFGDEDRVEKSRECGPLAAN